MKPWAKRAIGGFSAVAVASGAGGIYAANQDNGGWTADWNGTDFASAGQSATYQPTNLPAGYEGAGYQLAPFGPDVCDC